MYSLHPSGVQNVVLDVLRSWSKVNPTNYFLNKELPNQRDQQIIIFRFSYIWSSHCISWIVFLTALSRAMKRPFPQFYLLNIQGCPKPIYKLNHILFVILSLKLLPEFRSQNRCFSFIESYWNLSYAYSKSN